MGGVHRRLEKIIESADEDILGSRVLLFSENKYAFFFVKYTFDNEESDATSDLDYIKSVLELSNPKTYDYLVLGDSTENEEVKRILAEKGYVINGKVVSLSR